MRSVELGGFRGSGFGGFWFCFWVRGAEFRVWGLREIGVLGFGVLEFRGSGFWSLGV